MLRHLSLIALASVLTAIGVAAGWYAANQSSSSACEEDAAPEEAAAEDDGPKLDKRTLGNLGVEVGPAKRKTFVRYRAVQAIIEDRPRNLQPIVSPLGGIVTAVEVEAGGAVVPGARVLVLARNPIPRPKPDLTVEVLKPVSEEVHASVAALRSALGRMAIVDANLARVHKAREGRAKGSFQILRKSEIEFQNERAATALKVDAARRELARHGLSPEDIKAVESGVKPPISPRLWAHALKLNGLWPQAATAIRAALPQGMRDSPWVIAAIGELSAHGLATEALAAALRADKALSPRFAEVASLLLQGTPLSTIRVLARTGALEETTVLRAPAGAERWDVEEVLVRPGRRVEAGEVLLRLHDARTMWLRLEPIGEEIGHVVRALSAGTELMAVPLTPDAGPELHGLRLQRMAMFGDIHERGGRAYAEATNTRLCPAGEDTACSWNLRVGLRYVVQVPVQEMPGRFVFPIGALTTQGQNRVIYIQDGDSFRAQTVRVEYEDDEIAVVADDGGIFEGDPIALTRAFALGLALQADDKPKANAHGHAH